MLLSKTCTHIRTIFFLSRRVLPTPFASDRCQFPGYTRSYSEGSATVACYGPATGRAVAVASRFWLRAEFRSRPRCDPHCRHLPSLSLSVRRLARAHCTFHNHHHALMRMMFNTRVELLFLFQVNHSFRQTYPLLPKQEQS